MINTKDLIKILKMYENTGRLFHVSCYPSGVLPYAIAIAGVCGFKEKEIEKVLKILLKK